MNRPTLMQRINRRLDAHRNGEAGLALLDVLLGMAIFALIAVIAVQAMGQFRERAFVTQATSDAKQVGVGIEAGLTAPNATLASTVTTAAVTDTGNITNLSELGVNLTGTNRAIFAVQTGENASAVDYTICVDNGDGSKKHITYDSLAGAVGAPVSGECAGA